MPEDAAERQGTHPILWNYLVYTFARLEYEHGLSSDKIITGASGARSYACFNTGLVTPLKEEIFAAFEKNPRSDEDGTPWRLWGFRPASDHQVLAMFDQLPKLANYFDDPADLLYDRRRELYLDVEHIIKDNLDRFPAFVNGNEHLARQLLNAAQS